MWEKTKPLSQSTALQAAASVYHHTCITHVFLLLLVVLSLLLLDTYFLSQMLDFCAQGLKLLQLDF